MNRSLISIQITSCACAICVRCACMQTLTRSRRWSSSSSRHLAAARGSARTARTSRAGSSGPASAAIGPRHANAAPTTSACALPLLVFLYMFWLLMLSQSQHSVHSSALIWPPAFTSREWGPTGEAAESAAEEHIISQLFSLTLTNIHIFIDNRRCRRLCNVLCCSVLFNSCAYAILMTSITRAYCCAPQGVLRQGIPAPLRNLAWQVRPVLRSLAHCLWGFTFSLHSLVVLQPEHWIRISADSRFKSAIHTADSSYLLLCLEPPYLNNS